MENPLTLVVLPECYAICRLAADAPWPTWAIGDFVSVTRTTDELSVVCPQKAVPPEIWCESGWRCLRVAGTLDFATVGIVASLTAPLAEASISVFVMSSFDTDYVLVREQDLARACAALRRHGHRV
jgi:hypothetical protein